MSSLILATAARILKPLLLAASLFLLLVGHNQPGGGFVGGLVAAAAFSLVVFAQGPAAARRALPVRPRLLVTAGLILAAVSGVAGLVAGGPFLTALWAKPLGTPLLFDVGVYLVVVGVTLALVLALGARAAGPCGRVASAAGPDARRRDAGDAEASSRSGNKADGPAPPQPEGREGVAGACGVVRRRRCAPASPPPRALPAPRKTLARDHTVLPRRLLPEE